MKYKYTICFEASDGDYEYQVDHEVESESLKVAADQASAIVYDFKRYQEKKEAEGDNWVNDSQDEFDPDEISEEEKANIKKVEENERFLKNN